MKRCFKNTGWNILVIMLAVFLVGCTPNHEDWESSASISITKRALRLTEIAYVKVSVSGEGISIPIQQTLTHQNNQWKGLIEHIPAGKGRRFQAIAFDGKDQPLFEGIAENVELLPNMRAGVMITLQQKVPPNPFHNTVPVIDTVTATALQVEPGESVTLVTTAHDDDSEDTLSYTWAANQGTFHSPKSAKTIWTAPTIDGSYSITLTVSDNHGASLVVSITIQVTSAKFANAELTASFNRWPQIQSIFADPGRVNREEPMALRVIASDLDSDNLTYKWSAEGTDCQGGKFSDVESESPIWMAPAKLPSSKTCTLKVQVSDGQGGSTQGTLVIQVGEAVQIKVTESPDRTAPVSTLTPPDGRPFNFIFRGTVMCKDEGSGCNRIVYTLDGSTPSFDPPNGTIVKGGTANIEYVTMDPFTVLTVRYASEDKAGNREFPQSASFPFYQ